MATTSHPHLTVTSPLRTWKKVKAFLPRFIGSAFITRSELVYALTVFPFNFFHPSSLCSLSFLPFLFPFFFFLLSFFIPEIPSSVIQSFGSSPAFPGIYEVHKSSQSICYFSYFKKPVGNPALPTMRLHTLL